MTLGYVQLRVQSLEKQKEFYQMLGFHVIKESNSEVIFGAGSTEPILILTTTQDAVPRPTRTTGLFHFAILVPSREDLAHVIGNLLEIGAPISGAGDHLYSEAFYLSDPEGNGIEIYRDLPRSEWLIEPNGQVNTATEPIDLKGIMALYKPDRVWKGFPGCTILGHMHLNVTNLDDATSHFYLKALGLDLMTNFMDSAFFMSAGGYHHHIATNIWQGVGAPLPPENAIGLMGYSLKLSSKDELNKLKENLLTFNVSFSVDEGKIIVKDLNKSDMIFYA